MTYHILAVARERFDVPAGFADLVGAVRYPAQDEVRRLDYLMRLRTPARAEGSAAELVALGLVSEIGRRIVARVRREAARDPLAAAAEDIGSALGAPLLHQGLEVYRTAFPPWPEAPTLAPDRVAELLAEVLLLTVVNRNPAGEPYRVLHGDEALRAEAAYRGVAGFLESGRGASGPALAGPGGLLDLLLEPVRRAPHSLLEQLRFLRARWADLTADLSDAIDLAMDLLREETTRRLGGAPAGPHPLPSYTTLAQEPERYSQDVAWMPSLVLIAKHALVWLYQLGVRYGRPITTLDEIPDPVLDDLAVAGITGLWLIGLWQRSAASRTIKHRCGNPEAVGSAYSIVDYRIEGAFGGEEAVKRLSERCWRRGIRLACDMVPNHTALDSRWVRERPDWFLSTGVPPFPSYTFASDNVAEAPDLDVRIEDHYYDRTDAAVVFRREDRRDGSVRYLYHGNDGTSTPWNDTAQLDFLRADVREAVIQQILAVARQFPVIRFDAAMVLTRKHFQRLWYPPLGSGGDIPSRAGSGVTQEMFDQRMPDEFWREVVDRVAAEVPGTLLLAEAFWLLEGYFVRTLGMHRVYNSAFMNMLKTEDNAGYRKLIRTTLEFDPEILKRYVNFMSNPDEEPAAVQFGSGDKYFGVTVLMATLPGLPMFGHGQMEGAAEKYGMEYGRSYRDAPPDPGFVDRHRREISPLLRLRARFAEVASFRLYDLVQPDGGVNENVFAYTNRRGPEAALVVYNNAYPRAEGTLSLSVAYRDRARGDALVRRTLAEELGLTDAAGSFCVFRDHASGLEYIRPAREIHHTGLKVGLDGYRYHVFLDFREVRDNQLGHYARLAAELGGAGCASVERSVAAFRAPLGPALRRFLAGETGADRALNNAVRSCAGLDEAKGPARAAGRPSRGRAVAPPDWVSTVLRLRAALGLPEMEMAMNELRLPDSLRAAMVEAGSGDDDAARAASLLAVLWVERGYLATGGEPLGLGMIRRPVLAAYLGINWFDGHEWLRREPLEDLVAAVTAELPAASAEAKDLKRLLAAAKKAGYRVDRLEQIWTDPVDAPRKHAPPKKTGGPKSSTRRPRKSKGK